MLSRVAPAREKDDGTLACTKVATTEERRTLPGLNQGKKGGKGVVVRSELMAESEEEPIRARGGHRGRGEVADSERARVEIVRVEKVERYGEGERKVR